MNHKLKTVIREFLSSDKGSPVIGSKYENQFLEKRQEYINAMLKNKKSLVKRYGKDAEKVLTGRAVKDAKKYIEDMKQQDIKELVRKSLMEKPDTINSKQYISEREPVNEDDWMQKDDESDMAGSQLKSIHSNASKIENLIGDEEQLDAWVQAKLTKAQDYLQSVSDYLTGEEGEEIYEKKSKKDYDGDGKLESSEEEYKGVKDKAIKKAKGLAEERFKKGTDIGKKGPGFEKIAKKAGKAYGSEEAGKRVAGAVLQKILAKKGK
jgi:hypothetical protein